MSQTVKFNMGVLGLFTLSIAMAAYFFYVWMYSNPLKQEDRGKKYLMLGGSVALFVDALFIFFRELGY